MAMKDDRFTSPPPKYVPPKDIHNVLTPPKKDHTPATPLKEQEDNKLVQQLLVEAKMLSDKIIKEFPKKEPVTTLPNVRYCQAHVLDNKRFLEVARNLKITDKGAMSLLIANGGLKYLAGYKMLPAQAWDALLREKQNMLIPHPDKSFDKRPQYNGKARPIIGTPTTQERARRIGMYLVKKNEHIQQEDKEQYHEETIPNN